MSAFLILMFLGTLCLGYNDVQKKSFINKGVDERVVLCISFLGVGVFLGFVSVMIGIPSILSGFWTVVLGTILLNLVSQNLFMRAFALDDVSLIAPLRLITPLFVIVSGYVYLREMPSFLGFVGIALTIVGLYFFLAPSMKIKDLMRKSILYGVLASVLFALSFPLDKIAVSKSSAPFMTAIVFFSIGFFTTLWNVARDKSFLKQMYATISAFPYGVLHMSVVGSAGFVLTNQALMYSLVAYASSLKRLQALWTVLFAGFKLKEKYTAHRFIGIGIVFAGVFITAVS